MKNQKLINSLIDQRSSKYFVPEKESFLEYFNTMQKKWIQNNRDGFQMFFGGRRGGKTVGNLGKILFYDFYHNPEVKSLIIIMCSTKEHAQDLYWDKILKFNTTLDLGFNPHPRTFRIVTPRNTIMFVGLSEYRSIFKKLGLPIKLIIIEESQVLPDEHLKEFVDDVATWSTIDHSGVVCLSGNPTKTHHAYVYKLWNEAEERGIFKMETNIFLNPSIPRELAEQKLDDERRRRKLTKGQEDNAFKRMALGQWVADTDIQVFQPKPDNYYEKLPLDTYQRILGLDFGHTHNDAIAILAYSKATGNIYLEHEWQQSNLTLDQLSNKLDALCNAYNIKDVVYDPGGLGKKMGETLATRFSNLSYYPGNNSEKMKWIECLRTEIMQKRFLMRKDGIFSKETSRIFYTDDHQKLDEREGIHSDILPAIYYALQYVYECMEVKKEPEPPEQPKMTAKEYTLHLEAKKEDEDYELPFDPENMTNEMII